MRRSFRRDPARNWANAPRGRQFRAILRGSFRPLTVTLLVCVSIAVDVEAIEYFVSKTHPAASDSNNGLSLDRPFKTLGRGVQELQPGDILTIKAGVYREILTLGRSGTSLKPIKVRAYPGDADLVVIRGSNVASGWTNESNGVWYVNWDPLPLVVYPEIWRDYGELSRRREMVFIGGSRLQQVLSKSELSDGRFWVDAASHRIYVGYSGDLNSKFVEIAMRDRGIWSGSASYIEWDGLRVEHVANDYNMGAMHLGPNQKILNCRVENNNQVGISASTGTVMRNTVSGQNGRTGISLSGDGSLLDSCTTDRNSWRYGPGWACGGVKIIGNRPSGNTIVRHSASFNNGRGIYFDTTGSNNVVEASYLERNLIAGIQFEAAVGRTGRSTTWLSTPATEMITTIPKETGPASSYMTRSTLSSTTTQ